MRESRVWKRFHNELSDEFLLERIENPISPGWPDVFVQYKDTRTAGLVELKSRDTGHWVSRHQALTLRRLRAAGVRVAIITGSAGDEFHYWPVGTDYRWVEEILVKAATKVILKSLRDEFPRIWMSL